MRRRKGRKKKKPKTLHTLFHHAARRCFERYQVELTQKMYFRFNDQIRSNSPNVLFLRKESCSRYHWLIDDHMIVVYNTNLNGIVTFLPPEAIWDYVKAPRKHEDSA